MKTVEFLFPEFTNIFGESYNLEYLRRCNAEIRVVHTSHREKPRFLSGDSDMVYLGCMTEEKQDFVKTLLQGEDVKKSVAEDVIWLVTGNALELFNRDNWGVFDFTSTRYMERPRHNSQFIGQFEDMTLLGHKSQYSFSYGTFSQPFMEITQGIGMNPETKKEGIHVHHLFATYSLGPFLILNPLFTKYLLRLMGLADKLIFEEEIMDAYAYRLAELRRTIK